MIEVKDEQLEKAESPIEVTLFPIVTEVKEVHPEKAYAPIDVTLFGITIEVKDEQLKKADPPIEVTLSGIIVVAQPTINLLVEVSIIALQLFLESYTLFPSSTIIEVKEIQRIKKCSPDKIC